MHLLPFPLLLLLATCLYQRFKPLPAGLDYAGKEQPAVAPRLLTDLTYLDDKGEIHSEQQIFDAFFAAITNARRLILLDVFLYNSFQGKAGREKRPLAEELTACLLAQKKRYPEITIIVITDPINTVYGSLASPHFAQLRAAGISVVETRLERLRDSNPLYSTFWHLLCRPFGTGSGRLAPNPFDPGRVSLRGFLSLLNFKANHRKVLITDQGETLFGLVSSGNPHGASSSHTNVALAFEGPAVQDLLTSELAVLDFSGSPPPTLSFSPAAPASIETTVQVLTEKAIKNTILTAIARTEPGDSIDLLIFYLTDRQVIRALKKARQRKVQLRVLLDPNKDAFGRAKQGLPNRQVGDELHRAGIDIRWADTHGEQCHAKLLTITGKDGNNLLLLGSANLTRRNLDNFNLETNVAIRGNADAEFFADAAHFFDTLWHNQAGKQCSLGFAAFADPSPARKLLYRFLEATGLCTF